MASTDLQNEWIPTQNQSGYISSFRDPCTERFVKRAASNYGPALDLGAGVGHATAWALSAGCKNITATDPCESHVQAMARRLGKWSGLRVAQAALPDTGLPSQTFNCILISRVLHFFDASLVERSAAAIAGLLSPGGSAFVICDTIHAPAFSPFEREYQSRLSKNQPGAGYFHQAYEHVDGDRPELPSAFHFFEETTLIAPFVSAGLEFMWLEHQSRPDYPPFKIKDGREALGLEVRRPLEELQR